jgi:16S rRNA (cytosine1402-N4)-methyltransferase
MPAEVLRYLRPQRGGRFLDATVGGGGHAVLLLEADPAVRVIGLDRDSDAIEAARRRLESYAERVELIEANYRDVGRLETHIAIEDLAGALLDLGVSSHQIETKTRGFSYRPGTPLLMRMGGTTGDREPAGVFLNRASEAELGHVFREYGEERRWRALARQVTRRRMTRPFETSDDLVGALTAVLGRRATEREKARLFQAVRISVNDELSALEEGLGAIRTGLEPGGRLVAISYHSLEDRIVKNAFRDWGRECVCPPGLPECRCRGAPLGRVLTRKPLRPSQEEVDRNPRARSARLRVWEEGPLSGGSGS